MLSKNPVFPVLWKFYNLIPLAFKVKFPGGSQIANIHQIIEKSKRIPEKKNIYLLFIAYVKDFDCVKSVCCESQQTVENSCHRKQM